MAELTRLRSSSQNYGRAGGTPFDSFATLTRSGQASRPVPTTKSAKRPCGALVEFVAGLTGLEPATFRVTGGRSNQLSYNPMV